MDTSFTVRSVPISTPSVKQVVRSKGSLSPNSSKRLPSYTVLYAIGWPLALSSFLPRSSPRKKREAEKRKACLAISLSFDQFQLGHMAFHHAVIDPPGETSSHRVFVFLNSSGKGLEFGKFAAFYLSQPGIKEFSRAGAQHPRKLLNQIIGLINFRVDLTEFDERLLLLGTQLSRAAKKYTCGLPWGWK